MSIDYVINQKKALDNMEIILSDVLVKLESNFDAWDYKLIHKFTLDYYQNKEFNLLKHLFPSLCISFLTWPLALLSSLVDSKEHSQALLKQSSFNFLIVYVKALALFIKTQNIEMKGDFRKEHFDNVLSSSEKQKT